MPFLDFIESKNVDVIKDFIIFINLFKIEGFQIWLIIISLIYIMTASEITHSVEEASLRGNRPALKGRPADIKEKIGLIGPTEEGFDIGQWLEVRKREILI